LALHSNLSVNSCTTIFVKAAQASEEGLKARALKYMMDRFGAVVKSEGFKTLLMSSGGGVGDLNELWECIPKDTFLHL
jgi:hypothetical protein